MQGSHLVAAWGSCAVCVWDMTSFELVHEFELWNIFGGYDVSCSTLQLCTSVDGKQVCAALDNGNSSPMSLSLLVFDIVTGERQNNFTISLFQTKIHMYT